MVSPCLVGVQAGFWGFRRSQKQLALFHFVEAVRSGSLKRGWLPKKRVRSAPILPVPAALAESDGGRFSRVSGLVF